MDKRLVPLNGLIALLSNSDDKWPKLLRKQGWERHQFEVAVASSLGNFRADAVIFRVNPDVILLCEAKSGRNLEQKQAKKYLAATLDDLRRVGAIPPPLRGREAVVRTLFVGMEAERPSLEHGLTALGITGPLLTVSRDRVSLTGTGDVPGLDDFDERHQGGMPPARFKVDHQSDAVEIAEVLVPIIAAAQARRAEFIGLEQICAEALPEWPLLPKGVQGEFSGRVQDVLTRLAAGPQRGDFRYEPRTGSLDGRVVIVATPADKDPRGMTQAWRAVEGRAARALNRRARPQVPGQMSLEDLAGEGGLSE